MEDRNNLEITVDSNSRSKSRPHGLLILGISIGVLTLGTLIINLEQTYQPIDRLISLLSRTPYEEFRQRADENLRRSKRLPTQEFFNEYDLDKDGVISPEEYQNSLPLYMQEK